MKVRLYSDLHREFDGWEVPVIDNEEEYVCVLAGDIAVARKHGTYDTFLVDLAKRHKAVIYVPGNHEYYGSSFDKAWTDMKAHFDFNFEECPNLYMLNGEAVTIDDVRFICATLWTDFNADGNAPLRMEQASMWMNDYRVINRLAETDEDDGWIYRGKLKPADTYGVHKEHARFIDDELYQANQREGLKTFVVTHHAPTLQSIAPQYQGDDLNAAYVSDLSELIRERVPLVWVHGHIHNTFAYTEGDTHVFTNPKGYPNSGWHSVGTPQHENPEFKEDGILPELNKILEV